MNSWLIIGALEEPITHRAKMVIIRDLKCLSRMSIDVLRVHQSPHDKQDNNENEDADDGIEGKAKRKL